MSLSITRDPRHRRGGAALIRLPAGTTGETRVVLRRDEGALALGPHGWQGAEHAFGPYPVETDARGAFVAIGPEIVDRVEAYEPLELLLPELGLSDHLAWPDGVLPSPGRADAGAGIATRPVPGAADMTARQAAPRISAPPVPPPDPMPAPEPEPVPEAKPVPEPEPEPLSAGGPRPGEAARRDGRQRDTRRPRLLAGILAALVLIAAAGGWWVFLREEDGGATGDRTEETADGSRGETASAFACTDEGVAALIADGDSSAAALHDAATACGGAGSRDRQVQLMDRLRARGDAAALLWFAERYDPVARPDDSPFATDPSVAARYYAEAAEAGADGAEAGLDALCARLRGDSDPMAGMVIRLHCN